MSADGLAQRASSPALQNPIERRRQTLNDGSILEYDVRGRSDGDAFLLLHGIGGSAASWHPLMYRLSPDQTAIAWNGPGYGASTNVSSDTPTVSDYVDRLESFVEKLDLHRIHLVGHSWGTLIAAAFANRRQDKLLSVTLLSPSLGLQRMEKNERDKSIQARLAEVRAGLPAWVKAGATRLVAPNAPRSIVAKLEQLNPALQVKGLEQAIVMLASADPIKDLAKVKRPIMVVYGTEDQMTPVRFGDEFAEKVSGLRFEMIEECGHVPVLEQPDKLQALLESHWSASTL